MVAMPVGEYRKTYSKFHRVPGYEPV